MPFREPEDLQDAPSGPSHSSSLGRLSKPDTDTPGLCGCGTPGPRGQRAPPRAPALGAPQVRGNPDPCRCSASNLRGRWARSRLGSLNLRGQLGSWMGSAENRKLHQVRAGQARGGGSTVPRELGVFRPQGAVVSPLSLGATMWAGTACSRFSECPLRECRGLPGRSVCSWAVATTVRLDHSASAYFLLCGSIKKKSQVH